MPVAITEINEVTVQQGMRELGMMLLGANDATAREIRVQITQVLHIGAGRIDQLERELAYERAINEQLRNIQPEPKSRQIARLMIWACIGAAFWFGITVIWPIVNFFL